MIVFKTLSWKNLLSTGNQPTVVQLNGSPSTLILGTNGSGKSTMLDALCYVLFKKPFRKINKPQLVNTINNGACEIEVEFSIGTNEYKVCRGIKPDYFEIYVNGERRKQEAAKKDDQAFLEEDILKVNYDSFTQVVILGNAKYTPFMQLDAKKRRDFIEHILDIGVFSAMNDSLKTRQSTLKTSLEFLMKDLSVVDEQINMVKGFIEKLELEAKKATEETQQKIDEQTALTEELDARLFDLNAEISVLNKKIRTATKTITDNADAEILEIENNASQEQSELERKRRDKTSNFELQLKATVTTLRKRLRDQLAEIDEKLNEDVSARSEEILDTSALEEQLRKFEGLKTGILSNIASAKAKIEFYTQTTACKTCGQDISSTHRDSIIQERTTAISSYEEGLVKIEAKIAKNQTILINTKATNKAAEDAIRALTTTAQSTKNKLTTDIQEEIDALTDTTREELRNLNDSIQHAVRHLTENTKIRVSDIRSKASTELEKTVGSDRLLLEEKQTIQQETQSALNTAQQYIRKLQADMKRTPGNIDEQVEKLAILEGKMIDLQKKKEDSIETRHYYEIAAVLLKDTGIKSAIIKQYLPAINRLVNKYLTDMDFFVSFTLDENFDETFKSRHRDTLQYNSFSEGEKLRIDLALLLAWRDIARMKNSCSTNLLILDEVIDSSLDQNGTDFFIRMLNELGASSNVFVISHKNDAALDKFQNVLRFAKIKNFSHLVEAV